MHHKNQTFNSDDVIANTFNFYLTSVFTQKSNFLIAQMSKFEATISNADLDPSLFDVESMRGKCDDTNSMVSDQNPSFVFHSASKVLASLVCELFRRILTEQTWPDIWEI